jgi:hypothetical protein
MIQLWRSKVRADTVMVFAATLDASTLRIVLRAMQDDPKQLA